MTHYRGAHLLARPRPPPHLPAMPPPSTSRPLPLPFASILELYERGQYLEAWEAGRGAGPLESWPDVEPRLLAGRLAMRLGAPRLSRLLQTRVFRRHPRDAQAQYYYIGHIMERRGLTAAWQTRRRLGPPPPDDPQATADYHGQCAQLLGSLRDF